jgi:hypothetical protein
MSKDSSNRFPDAITKDVATSLAYISSVEQEAEYLIQSEIPVLQGQPAKSYLEDNKFKLALWTSRLLDQNERHRLVKSDATFICRNSDRTLAFDFKSFSHMSYPLFVDPYRYEFTVKKYHTSRIRYGDHWFRAIIPTSVAQKPGSHFESGQLRIDSIVYSAGLVNVKLAGHTFNLFGYSPEKSDRHFLFIDCVECLNFHPFLDAIETLTLAYGFATGYYPRDRRYILGSNNSEFTEFSEVLFDTLPGTFSSEYCVVPTFAMMVSSGSPGHLEFPQSAFEDLCDQLLSHRPLARAIMTLLEGHTTTIELRAAVYSIALEAITDIISQEHSTSFVPIPRKSLARKFLKELNATLMRFKADISVAGIDTLLKKLQVINSPTNKDKLLKPFELYHVVLTTDERNAIEKRNDFLHGRFPYDPSDDNQRFQMEQTVLTLLYCSTVLILKYVGYAGPIAYYPAFNQLLRHRNITSPFTKRI